MRVAILSLVLLAAGCSKLGDPNASPVNGKSGLPANCRAYIATAVSAYRAKQYTADETMNGIERNCGLFGQLWGYPDQ